MCTYPCVVCRDNRCLMMQESKWPEGRFSVCLTHKCHPFLLLIRRKHGKVTSISHHTAFFVTEPIIKHSHRVVPFIPLPVWLLRSHLWESRESKSVWMRISISSSNQVKMSVCHIKDNDRNPFVAPCHCSCVKLPTGEDICLWKNPYWPQIWLTTQIILQNELVLQTKQKAW